jgi:hypothetical protein
MQHLHRNIFKNLKPGSTSGLDLSLQSTKAQFISWDSPFRALYVYVQYIARSVQRKVLGEKETFLIKEIQFPAASLLIRTIYAADCMGQILAL